MLNFVFRQCVQWFGQVFRPLDLLHIYVYSSAKKSHKHI